MKEIEGLSPFELARLRQKRVEHSTRDKARLLVKVVEIEELLNLMGKKIEVKNI
ncbi:hypothetical protein SAMN04487995_0886 [Dyadobacter koreensis]|uniref:Uncharacterized protein n=1 Tax=Dyadobacter koreensis TaxID=408657 RepID=A0A1H6R3H7_9BACT|nr:hypothetical protein [Dyadobacter koreensis]SEI45732.1 hypothetical protein SAMN04487995_0886 [Dyadobacter koreensis]